MYTISKVFILLLVLFSTTLFGQINKGSIYLGVNMGASFQQATSKSSAGSLIGSTTGSPEWNSFYSFAPTFGYFFNSRFSAGLSLGFNYSSIIQESTVSIGALSGTSSAGINSVSRINTFAYFVSPNVGYTIPFSEKLYLFNQAVFSFSYSSTPASASTAALGTGVNQSGTIIQRNLAFGIQPTLVYFFHKRVSLNISLGSIASINNLNTTVITQNNIGAGSFETVSSSAVTNFSFLGINTNLTGSSNSNAPSSNSLMPTLGVYFWLK